MRIEILVDNEEPRVFSLNKPKLLIGSMESCDIILNTGGISRKHVAIVVEEDSFFVVDQGSTNGSYINEERLIPGRKTDFTTFFPVRLGDNVLITLLSDDEADQLGHSNPVIPAQRERTSPNMRSDATRSIPLSTLRGAKTNSLVKKRNETVVKRKTDKTPAKGAKKKDEGTPTLVKIIPLLILAVAIYFNFFAKEEVAVVAPEAPKAVQNTAQPSTNVVVPKFQKVDKESLIVKSRFEALSTDIHCTNDIEKYLCDLYASSPALKPLGTVQVGTMVNSIFDGQSFYEKARAMVPDIEPKVLGNPDADEIREYNENINFVTMLLFVSEGLPKNLNWDQLKDVDLTFALKITHAGPESDPQGQNLIVGAFVPLSLKKLLATIEPVHMTMIKKYGTRSIYFLKDYFVVY